MKLQYIIPFCLLFLCIGFSCTQNVSVNVPTDLPLIDTRGLFGKNEGELSFISKINSVEYIPLKTNIQIQLARGLDASKEHLYLSFSHYEGKQMFDRQGNYEKEVASYYSGEATPLSTFLNESANQIYHYGYSQTKVYDSNDGTYLGEIQDLYPLPPQTIVFPLEEGRFLVFELFDKPFRDMQYIGATIYDDKGNTLLKIDELNPFQNEPNREWANEVTSLCAIIPDGYLFMTHLPWAPYQIIYKATKDEIKPVFYFVTDRNLYMGSHLNVIESSLYFVLLEKQNWNYSMVEYNINTGDFNVVSPHTPYAIYSWGGGAPNKADNGYPIYGTKHYPLRRELVDIIYQKNVISHFELTPGAKEKAPEILQNMTKPGSAVIAIYHY